MSYRDRFNFAASGRPVAHWRYIGGLIRDLEIGWRTFRRKSKVRDALLADGLLVEKDGFILPTPFGLLQYASWLAHRE